VSALHVALSKRFIKGDRGQYIHLDERLKFPMVEFLLDNGADVNPTSNVSSPTEPDAFLCLPFLNFPMLFKILISLL
jgi:hypothetical protein